jgi:hypothetical protein
MRAAFLAILFLGGALGLEPPPAAPLRTPSPSILHVDNAAPAGGDGSAAAPFPRLQDAESRSAAGDTIVLHRGDGSTRGQDEGIRLKPGQRLMGAAEPAPEAAGRAAAPRPRLSNRHGDAITLAQGARVEGLDVVGPSGSGLAAQGVGEVTVDQIAIVGAGADGIRVVSPSGRLRITGAAVDGAHGSGIRVEADAGSAEIAIAGSRISRSGEHGVSVRLGGTAELALQVDRSSFAGNRGSGVAVVSAGAAGGSVAIADSTLEGDGVEIALTHQGVDRRFSFAISGNRIRQRTGGRGTAVSVFLGGASTAGTLLVGTVSGNAIGNAAIAASGSAQGNGIDLFASGAGTLTAAVTGNTVRQVRESAVRAISSAHRGALNLTLTGNDLAVDPAAGLALYGIDVTAGALPSDSGKICFHITGNQSARGERSLAGISLQTAAGKPAIEIEGYGGAPGDSEALARFLNGGAAVVSPSARVAISAGTVRRAAGPCPVPAASLPAVH